MKTTKYVIAVSAAVISLVLLVALVLMMLWNWLMPDLFGIPEVSFIQSLGIMILSSILFRSHVSGSSK